MPGRSFLFCALIPPGSVEAEVGIVQSEIFSAHGLASAIALPPMVPVAFLGSPAGRDVLPRLNASVSSGWRMRLGGTAWHEGHLFAKVSSDGAWTALCACARGACIAGPELFPVREGFYLGCADAPPQLRQLIQPAVPGLSFSSASIALLAIDTPFEGADWWREVHWEILEEKPLRGKRP